MQEDFHYYATYCAAIIAGYSHKESMEICYSAQFVDCCSVTFLNRIKASKLAATTQLSLEMMSSKKDIAELQEITRIWSSFHFLPGDLYAEVKGMRRYKNKYRLICNTNSSLLVSTIKNVKGKSLQAVGLAMHVLADTWAHRYFAGTPSFVINNTTDYFFEILPNGEERKVKFRNSVSKSDDIEKGIYTRSMQQTSENSIMNLGHGRAGHFPDYSFAKYKYLPAWKDYEEVVKDNPSDYYHAFCQMVEAMLYLRGKKPDFQKHSYSFDAVAKYKNTIDAILQKRQLSASKDWKAFGQKLSGHRIEDFDISTYEKEYKTAKEEDKSSTFLGKFILASLSQKSLVTHRIYKSRNPLAGISIEYSKKGLKGIREYFKLLKETKTKAKDAKVEDTKVKDAKNTKYASESQYTKDSKRAGGGK
jgi:hypothetical protein